MRICLNRGLTAFVGFPQPRINLIRGRFSTAGNPHLWAILNRTPSASSSSAVGHPHLRLILILSRGPLSTAGNPHPPLVRRGEPEKWTGSRGQPFFELASRGSPDSGFPWVAVAKVAKSRISATKRLFPPKRHFFFIMCAHTRVSQKRLHMQALFRSKPYAFPI